MSGERARPHPFAPFEAHPFEAPARAGEAPAAAAAAACAFCGEHRAHILHHPTRIRAACLLRGLDPASLRPGGAIRAGG